MFDKRLSNEVKGIAIILMLMHHLFGCLVVLCEKYGVVANPFSWENLYTFCVHAKVCVSMYVFITAYGITISYNSLLKNKVINKIELEKFSLDRYVKLFFNYGFIWMLAIITSPLRDVSLSEIYGEGNKGVMYAIIDAMGFASFFGSPTLNETWWYMTLAFLLIFMVPVLIKSYKSCGILLVVISAYFTYLGVNDSAFTRYLFCIMMGILFAEENIFERVKRVSVLPNTIFNKIMKCVIFILMIVFLLYLRKKTNWSYWIDTLFTICICCLCMELHNVPLGVNRIMEYLGRHSMNIFLVHTLIFEYYFTEFIYGFKHWILITFALLMSSLLVSILCERIKKIIKFYKFVGRIKDIINNKLLAISIHKEHEI